jgi:hypothetical protein
MKVKIYKSEWHQIEKKYVAEIDEDLVNELYPDNTKKKNKEILKGFKDGTTDIEEFMSDAFGEIDIDWEHEYDDLWTDRKGGYDITYEVEQ